MSKLLVIVAGPTASGKTSLAIKLALHFHTEIISADSRQFFKELTIGTAKPSASELAQVKHHLINSHSVSEKVTAGTFELEANKLLELLFINHDVIILAGGSGLYIDALINGIDELPGADPGIRESLDKLYETGGVEALRIALLESDPGSSSVIDMQNPRRMMRALEVTIQSGIPYSTMIGKKSNSFAWKHMMAGIDLPREELYNRINERTEAMIRNGLKQEAESVLAFRDKNALSTVGYKEMFDHLDGKITLEEAASQIARHTRNYAKRQLTWFRRYPQMEWIKPEDGNKLIERIEKKLLE